MQSAFRPTYFHDVQGTRAPLESLRELVEGNEQFQSQFRSKHAIISFVESSRHAWSPWLNVEQDETEQGNWRLVCYYSPHPSIWTAFAFSYLVIGVVLFFDSMYVLSAHLAMGAIPWPALALLGVCVILAVVLWVVSQAGQRLAQDQIAELQALVNRACGEKDP